VSLFATHGVVNPTIDAGYNPIVLPRISFRSGERGRGGHVSAPEGKESLQISLFEGESDDPA